MTELSFIMLSRRFFEHAFWLEERHFSPAEAWLDCVRMAAFRPHRRLVKGEIVEIPRGGIVASERFLSDRWTWSRTKVRSFLDTLKKEAMISVGKDHGNTIIMLCNFERYNTRSDEKEPGKDQGKTNGEPPEDQIEEGKECFSAHAICVREALPKFEEVLKYAGTLVPPCAEDYAQKWFEEVESRGWCDRNGIPIQKWKPSLSAWWRGVRNNQAERGARGSNIQNKHANRTTADRERDRTGFEPAKIPTRLL